jgi:fatty-acyl-CoA synthase
MPRVLIVAARAEPSHRTELAARAATQKNTDAINIQFTSGATGSPKGATLSHRNILNNAYFVGQRMGAGEGDHGGGMVVGTLLCILHGTAMAFPSECFDPLASLEAIAAERCGIAGGVPTMFLAMFNHSEFARFDLISLRTGWAGVAPNPVKMMRQCLAEMHLRDLTIIFGITETSPVCLQTAPSDPFERKVGSVGSIPPPSRGEGR